MHLYNFFAVETTMTIKNLNLNVLGVYDLVLQVAGLQVWGQFKEDDATWFAVIGACSFTAPSLVLIFTLSLLSCYIEKQCDVKGRPIRIDK